MLCLGVGVVGCCVMGFARQWLPFLMIFVLAKIGYSGRLVYYDSMLSDVATPGADRRCSSRRLTWGTHWKLHPLVVCLALVLGAGAIGLGRLPH